MLGFKKNISLIFFLIIIISLSFINTGCCGILDIEKENGKHSLVVEDIEDKIILEEEEEYLLPAASINVFQKSSDGFHFEKGNPVYFSVIESEDSEEGNLTYIWEIEGDGKIYGDRISYIFEEAGEYEVFLTVSDEITPDTKSSTLKVVELKRPIISVKDHKCSVKIDYVLENRGPGTLKNVIAMIDTPQTYLPFQKVLDISYSKTNFEKLFDHEWNLISKFELGDISEGEKVSVILDSNVILSEFDFDITDSRIVNYSPDDRDIKLYTKSEPYIESDSFVIKNIVSEIAGDESDPEIIAEKLYNFVISSLDYDYKRLDSGSFEYKSATEILNMKKGVCVDYSILYITLCRAAQIPAKLILGVPVLGILQEKDNELRYGHAWVEIKLPSYGWIPIDVTQERRFMSNNYFLNLKTYEGLGSLNEEFLDDKKPYYHTGFTYSWEAGIKPDISQEIIYSVEGIGVNDINMILEGDFLKNLYNLLDKYNSAINHINVAHGKGWVFNDPKHIALEESLLTKLIELSESFEKFSYPQSYEDERSNLLKILTEINTNKRAQIESMKSGNYEEFINNYNNFIASLNLLFDNYNRMSNQYNQKYG